MFPCLLPPNPREREARVLGNHGVDFPQLKMRGSVLRTEPVEGMPEQAVGASDFAFRKRLDGGYTVAHRGASVAEIVPDSFRTEVIRYESVMRAALPSYDFNQTLLTMPLLLIRRT